MTMRARLQKLIDMIADADEGQRALRRAALARAATLAGGALPQLETLPAALAAYVERVARHAWKITDEDVAGLRAAGYGEDTIYEVTVAASSSPAACSARTSSPPTASGVSVSRRKKRSMARTRGGIGAVSGSASAAVTSAASLYQATATAV